MSVKNNTSYREHALAVSKAVHLRLANAMIRVSRELQTEQVVLISQQLRIMRGAIEIIQETIESESADAETREPRNPS